MFPFLDWTNRTHDSCTDMSLPTNTTAESPRSLWCSTSYEWTDSWQLCTDPSCPDLQESEASRFGSGEENNFLEDMIKQRRQISNVLMQGNNHLFCLEPRSSQISQGNLITTLPTWGPSYRITFELYINSFDGANLKNGRLAELLRLTTTDGNCCAIGDRIPAIFTDKGGFIQVGTQIGNMGNKWKNVNLNEKTWYRLDLMQYAWNNKVSVGSKGVLSLQVN